MHNDGVLATAAVLGHGQVGYCRFSRSATGVSDMWNKRGTCFELQLLHCTSVMTKYTHSSHTCTARVSLQAGTNPHAR